MVVAVCRGMCPRSGVRSRSNRNPSTLNLNFLLHALFSLFPRFNQLRPRTGQHTLPRILNPPSLLLSPLNVTLGIIITPQSKERQTDAKPLQRMYPLRKPDNRDTNHRYSFDQRGDRVRDRRCLRKQHKRNNILQEMHRAVQEEIDGC